MATRKENTTSAMLSKLYALLTDADVATAPIYVFHDRLSAEQALRTDHGNAAAIVPFLSASLSGAVNGLVYFAMTMEDTGMRIRAAFRSMFELRSFMLEHVSESVYLTATGWLEPVLKDGRLVEEFHITPATLENNAA